MTKVGRKQASRTIITGCWVPKHATKKAVYSLTAVELMYATHNARYSVGMRGLTLKQHTTTTLQIMSYFRAAQIRRGLAYMLCQAPVFLASAMVTLKSPVTRQAGIGK